MSSAHPNDAATTTMRASIAVIEQELAQTPRTEALHTAWRQLVDALALGPAPLTRECPRCHGIGMRAATRCSNCWAALAPLPAPTTHQESP